MVVGTRSKADAELDLVWYNDVSYLASNHNSTITKVCNFVAKLTVNQAKIMRGTKLIILTRIGVRVPGFVYYAWQWLACKQALLGRESLLEGKTMAVLFQGRGDLGFEKPFSDPKPSSVWLTYLLLIPLLIQLKNVCLGSSNRRRVKGRPRFPSTGLGLLPITVSTDHGNRISYRGRFYVHAKPNSVPRSVVDISEYASPPPPSSLPPLARHDIYGFTKTCLRNGNFLTDSILSKLNSSIHFFN